MGEMEMAREWDGTRSPFDKADEKLDLDALERALIGSAMGLTFRECQTLIKYARALENDQAGWLKANAPGGWDLLKLIDNYGRACRRDGSPAWESDEGQALKVALESRASNAGGAVAWSVTNDGGRSISSVLFADYYDAADHARRCGGMTKPIRVYTHPAPASKEPVADEGISFDEWYAGLSPQWQRVIEADSASKGWTARAALATAQTVPDGWLLVPVEPTDAMLDATRGKGCSPGSWNNWAKKRHATIYRQMLAAAPAKPEGV